MYIYIYICMPDLDLHLHIAHRGFDFAQHNLIDGD